ncbi:hypothetical protein KIN20_018547, partial [Parelaphostrongylus tenuis]
VPKNCGATGHINSKLRALSLGLHNTFRMDLANGTVINGRKPTEKFPTASDMSLLTYDCELEEKAFNLSKMCLPFLDPRFSNTTFNYGTYTLSDERRPLSMYPDINVPKLFGVSDNICKMLI